MELLFCFCFLLGLIFTYKEEIDSEQPGNAGFSVDGGRASATYLVDTPDEIDDAELRDSITEIIGGTSLLIGPGKLKRTLPLAHPLWPWMTAVSADFQGVGGDGELVNSDDELGVPAFPQFWLYPQYKVRVEFRQQPYAILPDNLIIQVNDTYYDTNGNPVSYTYYPEWIRYTDFDYTPQNDTITAQQGFMQFLSGSAKGKQFPAMIKQFLPNGILKFRWYQVPYRYISPVTGRPSFIEKWRGYINQNDWYNWKAGQLLYLNYNVRRYNPPVPEETPFFGGGGLTVQSTDKLCDIEFLFLLTTRTSADAITAPTNKNFITKGHNLLPWMIADRKFHYAETIPNPPVTGVPSWYSFPIQQLFMDPDA